MYEVKKATQKELELIPFRNRQICKYPFDKMEVNEKFAVPKDIKNVVNQSAWRYAKLHKGVKFKLLRTSETEYACIRIK